MVFELIFIVLRRAKTEPDSIFCYNWLDGMATRIVPGASGTRCARSTRYGRSARNIVCTSWDRNPKYFEKHWEKLLERIVHGSNESQKPSKLGLLVLG